MLGLASGDDLVKEQLVIPKNKVETIVVWTMFFIIAIKIKGRML
jgi:hypothetical protein